MRPEARTAARKQAIEEGKEKKATAQSIKKAEKAKTAAAQAKGQATGRYVQFHHNISDDPGTDPAQCCWKASRQGRASEAKAYYSLDCLHCIVSHWPIDWLRRLLDGEVGLGFTVVQYGVFHVAR